MAQDESISINSAEQDESDDCPSESNESELAVYPGKIEKGQNCWMGLKRDSNLQELMDVMCTNWYFRFISNKLIFEYGGYKWRKTHYFQNTEAYSSLAWLPMDFKPSAVRRAQRIVDAWLKEDPSLKELNLFDRKKDGYFSYNKDKFGSIGNTIYLDIIYKKQWFSKMGITNTGKIYFYRNWFDNTKQGRHMCRRTARRMIDRVNLCYLAWYKMAASTAKKIDPKTIPIVTWRKTDEKNNTGMNAIYKLPRWEYIVQESKPKPKPKPIANDNDEKQTTQDNTNHKMDKIDKIDKNTNNGLRRSARLAEKEKKQKKQSAHERAIAKYGPSMQKWLRS